MAIYKSDDAFGGAAAASAGHHFMDREEKRSEEETGREGKWCKEGRTEGGVTGRIGGDGDDEMASGGGTEGLIIVLSPYWKPVL